jgi:hypothetical protein
MPTHALEERHTSDFSPAASIGSSQSPNSSTSAGRVLAEILEPRRRSQLQTRISPAIVRRRIVSAYVNLEHVRRCVGLVDVE